MKIGLLGALALIFIVLKLTEVGAIAHWSWFWVLSPIIIPWIIIAAIALAMVPVICFRWWSERRAKMREFMED